MSRKMTGLFLACLLYPLSLPVMAEDTDPKTALPTDQHAQPVESNDQKAHKIGEESSGANAGADSQALEKDSATAKGKKDDGTTQPAKGAGE